MYNELERFHIMGASTMNWICTYQIRIRFSIMRYTNTSIVW